MLLSWRKTFLASLTGLKLVHIHAWSESEVYGTGVPRKLWISVCYHMLAMTEYATVFNAQTVADCNWGYKATEFSFLFSILKTFNANSTESTCCRSLDTTFPETLWSPNELSHEPKEQSPIRQSLANLCRVHVNAMYVVAVSFPLLVLSQRHSFKQSAVFTGLSLNFYI